MRSVESLSTETPLNCSACSPTLDQDITSFIAGFSMGQLVNWFASESPRL
jgi:hypothetical protein